MAERLGILLISAGYERAHYAFVLAAGAAAIGRKVCIFATNAGCMALLQDWSALDGAARDAAVRDAGVAGFDELREAAAELGVRLMACDAGLRMAGLDVGPKSGPLWRGVEVAGVPSFLSATAGGQIITL